MVEFAQVRQAVAQVLTDALGAGWKVYDHPRQLSGLTSGVGVVVVNRTRVAPYSTGMRATTLEVFVIEPKSEPGTSEDALETRLDAVLDALDTTGLESSFKGAERAMYAVGESQAHAYVITIEVITNK